MPRRDEKVQREREVRKNEAYVYQVNDLILSRFWQRCGRKMR
jgi:hypothetical protein